MKKIFLFLCIAFVLFSCKKTNITHLQLLEKHLTPADYAEIDPTSVVEFTIQSTGQKMIRAGFKDQSPGHFVILPLDDRSAGKIVNMEGKIENSTTLPHRLTYNGTITTESLDHTVTFKSVIRDGFILALHSTNIAVSTIRSSVECRDCTIPEVVVSSSPHLIEDPFAWLNLFWLMGGDVPKMEYLPLDGGVGGGGSSSLNTEEPTDKEKIDPKKYTDCFDNLPDGPTTIYSITIAADLPADGRPDVFFDWANRFPGHAFIELNKSTPTGTVAQRIGFYPNTSFKVLTGDYIESKIIDDGGHEYQASYTISVSAAAFSAAVSRLLSASSKPYQVSFYNCADFALEVFNAGGGGLTVPRHAIPGFEVDGGSNTPQGIYEKIEQLKNSGSAGAHTTQNKEYKPSSKGPCD